MKRLEMTNFSVRVLWIIIAVPLVITFFFRAQFSSTDTAKAAISTWVFVTASAR